MRYRYATTSNRNAATKRGLSEFVLSIAGAALLLFAGCGGASNSDLGSDDKFRGADTGTAGDAGGAGSRDGGGMPPPEEEEEFDFSAPAVVGDAIYVANETLNAVAAIDTTSLSIETVPVGLRPTEVVGPAPEHADSDNSRVMALNEGSHSVSVIDPNSRTARSASVMPGANALAMDPTGRFGIAWYDGSRAETSEPAGDLSSVSVITPRGVYQVAVGFHVREVLFSDDGTRALIWSDDGVSPIDLEKLDSDTRVPPVDLLPSDLQTIEPAELEIQVTADTRWVVTRSQRLRGVVLLDLENRKRHVVPTFEVPTDVDLIRGTDPTQVLIMLRQTNRAIRAEVPDGLVNAAGALAGRADDLRVSEMSSTSGHLDAGAVDGGAADTGGPDAADTGPSDSGMPADASVPDTGADTAASDTGTTDTARSDTATGDTDGDGGMPPATFPPIDAFQVLSIQVPGMGAASVASNGDEALLYTTVTDERRVVLLNLNDSNQRVLVLQKKVRGALSDARGDTFIVFNQKQPGEIPPDATPNDPEYVARSWGITLIDIETATKRLMLTRHEPGPTALWSPDSGASKVFTIFAPPKPSVREVKPEKRDVIEANLDTFRTETHRLPSIPEGLGPIAPAGKLFVSQRHPQGRMTFIDANDGSRATITGYQLNSEID